MTFGVLSFGTALGLASEVSTTVSQYSEDTERILAYGYRRLHRAAPEIGVTDLALAASLDAIERAGLTPADLDLIVFAPTDVPEYLYWDPSASLQQRLGAGRAQALLINQACTAGIVGWDIIAGIFATRPEVSTALLVAGNRTCERYWNRFATQSMVFSDGAAAAVLRRGHGRMRWLASDAITDGRYADFYRMDVGGAASPFTVDAEPREQPQARDAWDIMEFFDYDDEQFAEFVAIINSRAIEVVNRACARAEVKRHAIRWLITSHDNIRSTTSLAEDFGVPVAATNLDIGLDIGHLGAADQIMSLATLAERDQLAPGDLVALIGLGRGMHWACTLLEV